MAFLNQACGPVLLLEKSGKGIIPLYMRPPRQGACLSAVRYISWRLFSVFLKKSRFDKKQDRP